MWDLMLHLSAYESVGPDEIHPKLLKKAAWCHCKTSLNYFLVLEAWRGPGKDCPIFQDKKWDQHHFLPISLQCPKNCGEEYSGSYWKEPERQCSHWSQLTWFHKEKVLFNEFNVCLWQNQSSSWLREARWCNIFEFQQSFLYYFSHYPSGQLVQGTIMIQVNAWLMGQAQWVAGKGMLREHLDTALRHRVWVVVCGTGSWTPCPLWLLSNLWYYVVLFF